jgi:redox-sensitive bicupin YhaK (pirin superfamily)
MDRKEFLRKGLLGTAMLVSTGAIANVLKNDIDELTELTPVGYNHLPPPTTKIMENIVIHKANTRGTADHGWLKANFSFSFANYHNPERMHFGVLRVMNDDIIAAGMGFGTHPHDNMEIITIPLAGALEHKDSMGNGKIINYGDIQCMSAGTGIQHSEFNPNKDKDANTLQIWMFPNKKNVTPRYDQLTLDKTKSKNNLQQILSPNTDDDGVWVHQDAWFHQGVFDKDVAVDYTIKRKGNGVYLFVINGDVTVNGHELNKRDGFGIWDIEKINIQAKTNNVEVLVMDVPMTIA